MAIQKKQRQQSLLRALCAAAAAYLVASAVSSTFVAPRGAPRGVSVQVGAGGGEYTGFVPDMQRRQFMNFIVVATTAVPALVLAGAYIWYIVPPEVGGAGGGTVCGDIDGVPIKLSAWTTNHKDNDRDLVQGLKGEPYYLISTKDGVKDFGILSVCTHLGCVVPWVRSANKFCCPCHGSQYDENGKVVRGPAPLSLALSHVTVADDTVTMTNWKEQDFRTGTPPWWS